MIIQFDTIYPPSVNQLYLRNKNGGQRLSDKHRQFRDHLFFDSIYATTGKNPIDAPCSVTIELTPKDNRVRDIDNCIKVVLDALVKAKILQDDNTKIVKKIEVIAHEPNKQKPNCKITIKTINK